MFNFFPFKGGGVFAFGTFNKIDDMVESFLGDIGINEITDLYEDVFSNYENSDEEKNQEEVNFIKFESYDDMYLLTIELNGVNLRELSIRYDSGIIEINLNRLEINTNPFGIKTKVKNHYNKTFDNIEEIDTDNILKSIDEEMLSIRMPKRFYVDGSPEIVDIDYTEVVETELVPLDEENNSHWLNRNKQKVKELWKTSQEIFKIVDK